MTWQTQKWSTVFCLAASITQPPNGMETPQVYHPKGEAPSYFFNSCSQGPSLHGVGPATMATPLGTAHPLQNGGGGGDPIVVSPNRHKRIKRTTISSSMSSVDDEVESVDGEIGGASLPGPGPGPGPSYQTNYGRSPNSLSSSSSGWHGGDQTTMDPSGKCAKYSTFQVLLSLQGWT